MADMSRAIRMEVERHAPTLTELPDEVLNDFAMISSAWAEDLRGEVARRKAVAEAAAAGAT